MTNIEKTLKAKRLITGNKILRVYGSAEGKERFKAIGKGDSYDVVFDSRKNKWTCSCPNIREVYCYHIIACMMVAGRFWEHDNVVGQDVVDDGNERKIK